jgi:hypothetical protein
VILERPLRASRTHRSRSYSCVQIGHELADYALTIRQGEPHRVNYTHELYFVQRDETESDYGVVVFLLAKDSDEDPEVYEVRVSRGVLACTCTGFRCQKTCKHIDSLTDAMSQGVL